MLPHGSAHALRPGRGRQALHFAVRGILRFSSDLRPPSSVSQSVLVLVLEFQLVLVLVPVLVLVGNGLCWYVLLAGLKRVE